MKRIREMAETSDLVIVGTSGMSTSTGGSINARIEIEEVLKGQANCKRICIVFPAIGISSSPEMEPGERYIFFLKFLGIEDIPVYGLLENEPNAIMLFNKQLLAEIQTGI